MSTPNSNAARNLIDNLRALHQNQDGQTKLKVNLIDHLEHRLLNALERERSGHFTHDGWPTSTTGNGSTGTPTSSVEAAAMAILETTARDQHRDLTHRAARALEDAVVSINTLRAALSSIDDLTRDVGPPVKTCSHCTGKRPANDRIIHATGTVGDRLHHAIALCVDCYGYVTQTARPGSRTGWLPTDAEILQHEERGRWRIHRPEPQTPNPT